MRLKIVTLMVTCLFLIGCQQGNSTSGVDETDPYTQAQVETFVASAPSGTVGVYSASSENNQTAFMKCKVKWVYMYKTKTYLSLKGCTWSWAYVTGTWRTQGQRLVQQRKVETCGSGSTKQVPQRSTTWLFDASIPG